MGRIPGIAANECIAAFESVLGTRAIREPAKFDFLRGDPTPRNPRGMLLRVDAYFPTQRLVVEYKGRQHFDANWMMDRRPGRREQRARYQERRRELLPKHGYRLIEVRYDELLTRELVIQKLKAAGIDTA